MKYNNIYKKEFENSSIEKSFEEYYFPKNDLTNKSKNNNHSLKSENRTSDSKIESASTSYNKKSEIDFKAKKYAETIIDYLASDEYIAGENGKTFLYLESLYYQEDIETFRKSFYKSWLMAFRKSEYSIYTFISIVSSIPYEWLDDQTDSLVIAGYAHKSKRIKEATIRAIESWEQKEHVEYLDYMEVSSSEWLEEYKNNIIRYLKEL